jgi:hypothetical protein
VSRSKTCRICGETKPLDDFYKMAAMRDCHSNECKQCNLADKRRRYADGPAKDIAMTSLACRAIKPWGRFVRIPLCSRRRPGTDAKA